MTTQTDPSPLSPLGKPTDYCDQYAPELLFPIPRRIKRDEIGARLDMLVDQGASNGQSQTHAGRFGIAGFIQTHEGLEYLF